MIPDANPFCRIEMDAPNREAVRKARELQAQRDADRLAAHVRVAFGRLLRGPEAPLILASAQHQIDLWRERRLCSADYIEEWSALLAQPAGLPPQAILDGEVVVQDDIDRSDFDRLIKRARRRRWYAGADPVVYCVFDLLVLRGKDMRAEPLEARKAALRKLVKGLDVLYVDSVEDGQWLYDQVLQLELEGVVGKRLGSTYQAGVRSLDWIKVKRPGAVPAKRFRRKAP